MISLKDYDLIIFDMDGLMFDTEALAENIWLDIFKEHNLTPNKEFLDSIKGRNIPDSEDFFKLYYNTSISFLTLKEELDKRLEYELRHRGVPLKKGLVESLDYLKDLNKTLAVASSSNKALILANLKDTNLLPYFSYIVSGQDFKQSKPNPEIFLNVSTHFKIEPSRTIVLEDSKAGIEAALNAHMQAIWVPDLVKFPVPKEVIKIDSLLDVLNIK